MRRLLLIPLLPFNLAGWAGETLRVGKQVLAMGNAAGMRSICWVPRPTRSRWRTHLARFAASVGNSYVRMDGYVITVTSIAGKISSIEDHRDGRHG